MFESVNRRIADLKARRQQVLEKLRVLDDVSNELDLRLMELSVAGDNLKHAKRRLASLQSLTLHSLMASILGNRRDALRLAEDDLGAATVAYETSHAKVRLLESDVASLKQYNEVLSQIDSDISEAIGAKEKIIEHSPQASELGTLNGTLADLGLTRKELFEAVAAGKVAQEHLQEVIKSLESAASWGTWDMLGGGLIATAVKHSRLDDAKAHAQRAGDACRRFAKELGDVNMRLSSTLEIDGFIKFADYFFDNLFTDWAVQSKIGNALEQAKLQAQEIDSLLAIIEAELVSVAAQSKAMLRDKNEYIARL